ncbi:hypothetical protein ACNGN6_18735 [Escherichia coli]|uniref:Restriction endonuclease n=1 Tax=Salmonella enterica TaxID=28901 RepID=A0A764WXJ8_SALER|nr:hypothetical protein [Escherichia coli]HAG5111447.1 hypothetical protein [Salmonella enterica]EFH1556632.1 hypothetical protein [Escherichia coli]EFJ1932557.1 hypothetical protein [Escherichia coli]EFM0603742.1 hypothetical protein [Escherichia coli]EIN0469470.1 hypothetical protein [Escherichia coli]
MMQAPVITAALLVSPVLMVCLVFCLLAVLLMLILRGEWRKQKCARTRRHQRCRATVARLLARLTLWPDIELVSGQRLLKLLNGTLLTDKGERVS